MGRRPRWDCGPAGGGDARRLTAAAGHGRGLAWSPAGDRIALGLEGTMYTFATDGSDFTQIADGDTTSNRLNRARSSFLARPNRPTGRPTAPGSRTRQAAMMAQAQPIVTDATSPSRKRMAPTCGRCPRRFGALAFGHARERSGGRRRVSSTALMAPRTEGSSSEPARGQRFRITRTIPWRS
jgi:hypothetical protein